MTTFDIYLAITDKGCMAHVLDLPGCFSRGPTREAALEALPEVILTTLGDLQRHNDPQVTRIPKIDEVELRVAEVNRDATGPFDPGDTATLFSPEIAPINLDEMETVYFRRAGYNRHDLMALVSEIPEEVFDWKPDEETFSILRILRHIGNSDEWYVSRLVAPETLPPEWEHDEEMPIFEFLEMERRTAIERLRQLTEEERSRVAVPEHFTSNPGEPWTARKALRRLLEHEREHTAHIREVLAVWRAHSMARMAAARSSLLWQLAELDETTLTSTAVFEDYTAKDLLAHTGYWDWFNTERIRLVLDGRENEIPSLDEGGGIETRNAERQKVHQGWSLGDALTYFERSRESFLETYARVPDETLHRKRRLHWAWETSMVEWVRWRWEHDNDHREDLRNWRHDGQTENKVGPKSILLAIMKSNRDEILGLVNLVSPGERETRPIEGVWTLKDILGHLDDWEQIGLDEIQWALGGASVSKRDFSSYPETWNDSLAEARKDQVWEEVWEGFNRTHAELISLVEGLTQDDLAQPFVSEWSKMLYDWLLDFPEHDRDHAIEIRKALGLYDSLEGS